MRKASSWVLGIVAAVVVTACSTSPTGRSTLNFMSGSQLNEMGRHSFQQMKDEGTISTDPELIAYAQCLTDAIVAVLPDQYRDYDWEVAVFDEDVVNAFALPGGYMGVYTGMMKLAQNEHQLAAVMGHEVGHVIAEHGGERVSSQLVFTAGMVGADILLSDRPPAQRNLMLASLGVGAQVGVMLPFSRRHESEADEIGMDLMARAGFNPEESVRLWERMAELGGGGGPQFLSTHPAPQTRIRDLGRQLPDVMPLYEERLHQGPPPNCPRPDFESRS
ncbi:MAG: M48 family metallopeptidase [Idiomarina sp.]|nr:M48 family metallopeptidase [Idiomarina sp.]